MKLQKVYKTKLNFCDLAGSEKLSVDEDIEVNHLKELKSINLSLTTLGKVIYAMAQGKSSYIPYRESKLTRFLQDSIGKNSKTWLIATVSPTVETFDETLNTLKFADQAIKIKVKALNHSIEIKESEKIDELQKEVEYLKELLNLKRNGNPDDLHRQLYILKKENVKLKKIAVGQGAVPRNLLTSSLNTPISTARHPLLGIGALDSLDVSKEFRSPAEQANEARANNRYDRYINGEKLENTSKFIDQHDSGVFKNSKTTGVTTSRNRIFSREGRGSKDLQYAGAKVLAGNYKYDPTNLHQPDVIPVRIRSLNKIDNKTGSIAHNIVQQQLIDRSLKGNKESEKRLNYLNDLEKRMKAGFKYS
uniref:Kinesin motor domain-containing protein n=1 Tax=Euplotes harpa TaxID=151035 RepID=A0A7S3NBU1_9SPIT|mmetsp:Transcript_3411/g.4198  ORF Transcript_3411/g.4198 Transcript_3411/m.4198 type:complete len:362 (+) Transcript_3411:1105-2190(+)